MLIYSCLIAQARTYSYYFSLLFCKLSFFRKS